MNGVGRTAQEIWQFKKFPKRRSIFAVVLDGTTLTTLLCAPWRSIAPLRNPSEFLAVFFERQLALVATIQKLHLQINQNICSSKASTEMPT